MDRLDHDLNARKALLPSTSCTKNLSASPKVNFY